MERNSWNNAAQDVEVTGSYTINEYKITYKVTGEYFADDKVAEEFYDYGETVIPLATDMTKEGYTFSGWSEFWNNAGTRCGSNRQLHNQRIQNYLQGNRRILCR